MDYSTSVLWFIPLGFVATTVTLLALGTPLAWAIVVAAAPPVVVLWHALFRRDPVSN